MDKLKTSIKSLIIVLNKTNIHKDKDLENLKKNTSVDIVTESINKKINQIQWQLTKTGIIFFSLLHKREDFLKQEMQLKEIKPEEINSEIIKIEAIKSEDYKNIITKFVNDFIGILIELSKFCTLTQVDIFSAFDTLEDSILNVINIMSRNEEFNNCIEVFNFRDIENTSINNQANNFIGQLDKIEISEQ